MSLILYSVTPFLIFDNIIATTENTNYQSPSIKNLKKKNTLAASQKYPQVIRGRVMRQ